LTSPYAKGHPDPKTAEVIGVLSKWLKGMESGVAWQWQPIEGYQRSKGDAWTDAHLERLMLAIDEELQKELNSGWPQKSMGVTANADFIRLAPRQRLALAQELDKVISSYKAP
jgi:hypothetical protein